MAAPVSWPDSDLLPDMLLAFPSLPGIDRHVDQLIALESRRVSVLTAFERFAHSRMRSPGKLSRFGGRLDAPAPPYAGEPTAICAY